MISNTTYQAIAALDFTAIKFKLMMDTFGEGWSAAKADAIETEYRRFLYLQAAFPDEQTAPTLDVDTFWHYHILDTANYAADCEAAFGYFLHHNPYLGLMEGDAPGVDVEAGERTRALYEATFGEAYIRPEAYGEADGANETARCSGLCTATAATASGAGSARCQGLCTAAKPVPSGAQAARCQGLCTAAKPVPKGAQAARCQGLCTAAKPVSKGAQAARCQGLCTAAKPLPKGAQAARCQGLCTSAKPLPKGAQAARCQGLCTASAGRDRTATGKHDPVTATTCLHATVPPSAAHAR